MSESNTSAPVLTDDQRELARDLVSWKNYLYEATMSDYTIETINRAQKGRDEALEALEAAGVDPEQAVIWDNTGGLWKIA